MCRKDCTFNTTSFHIFIFITALFTPEELSEDLLANKTHSIQCFYGCDEAMKAANAM